MSALQATARRVGEEYLLNGVKWHVTSFNSADFAFFQAVLADGPNAGEHAMFLVDLPSPGVTVVRTPAYSHTISHHHPIVEFTDVRVPAAHLIGAEGDGMIVRLRVVPVRAAHGGGPLLGAAQRLTAEMTTFASERAGPGPADQQVRHGRGHARGQPDRAVRCPRRWCMRRPAASTAAPT